MNIILTIIILFNVGVIAFNVHVIKLQNDYRAAIEGAKIAELGRW